MHATCVVTLEESHIRAKSMGVQEADGDVPAEAISLDTGLRMEGYPASKLWDAIIDV